MTRLMIRIRGDDEGQGVLLIINPHSHHHPPHPKELSSASSVIFIIILLNPNGATPKTVASRVAALDNGFLEILSLETLGVWRH